MPAAVSVMPPAFMSATVAAHVLALACTAAHAAADVVGPRIEIAPLVFMPRLTVNAYPNTSSWYVPC